MTRRDKSAPHDSASTLKDHPAHSAKNGMAMQLTAPEIRADMVKILTYLKAHLDSQQKQASSFLTTDIQALLYAERVASYALHDYPRQFENDALITFLWDTFNRIVRTVAAWRTGKSGGDGQVELALIRKNVDLALTESQTAASDSI